MNNEKVDKKITEGFPAKLDDTLKVNVVCVWIVQSNTRIV